MAKKTYFLPPAFPPVPNTEWNNSMTDDIRAMLADATRRVLEHTKGPPPMTEAQKQIERGLKWAARFGDVDPPEAGMMPTDAQALAIAVLRGDESAAAALADEVASKYVTGDGWVSRDTLRQAMISLRNELVAWHRWDGSRMGPMLDRTAELVRQVDHDVPPDAREGWYGSRREPLAEANPPSQAECRSSECEREVSTIPRLALPPVRQVAGGLPL